MQDLIPGVDGRLRCWWCGTDPQYVAYHDEEWGRPTRDERYLFEKICLEGFQAGLSWLTILRKRDRLREQFEGFDPERVSRFGEPQIRRMLDDPGIVRHRGKIESAINNARQYLEMVESEGSLYELTVRYRPASSRRPRVRADVPAQTDESAALSRELKRRGWTFVGPTTMYAFMQAVGLVNDHLVGCAAGSGRGKR